MAEPEVVWAEDGGRYFDGVYYAEGSSPTGYTGEDGLWYGWDTEQADGTTAVNTQPYAVSDQLPTYESADVSTPDVQEGVNDITSQYAGIQDQQSNIASGADTSLDMAKTSQLSNQYGAIGSGDSAVSDNSLITNQLKSILNPDDELMMQAKAQGQAAAAKSGQLGSAAGIRSAQGAMYDRATTWASQNADTFAQAGRIAQQARNTQAQTMTEAAAAGTLAEQEAQLQQKQQALNNAFSSAIQSADQATAAILQDQQNQWSAAQQQMEQDFTAWSTEYQVSANMRESMLNRMAEAQLNHQIVMQELLGDPSFLELGGEAVANLLNTMAGGVAASMKSSMVAAGYSSTDPGMNSMLDDWEASMQLINYSGIETPTEGSEGVTVDGVTYAPGETMPEREVTAPEGEYVNGVWYAAGSVIPPTQVPTVPWTSATVDATSGSITVNGATYAPGETVPARVAPSTGELVDGLWYAPGAPIPAYTVPALPSPPVAGAEPTTVTEADGTTYEVVWAEDGGRYYDGVYYPEGSSPTGRMFGDTWYPTGTSPTGYTAADGTWISSGYDWDPVTETSTPIQSSSTPTTTTTTPAVTSDYTTKTDPNTGVSYEVATAADGGAYFDGVYYAPNSSPTGYLADDGTWQSW